MNRAVLVSLPAVLVPVIAVAQSVGPTEPTGSPTVVASTAPLPLRAPSPSPSRGASPPPATPSHDETVEPTGPSQLGATIRIEPTVTVVPPANPYARGGVSSADASPSSHAPDLSTI